MDIHSMGKLIFNPKNHTKKHEKQSTWKKSAIIMVDDDTSLYYRSIIEKRYPLIQGVGGDINWMNPPLRGTHVTIINDKFEDLDKWNKLKEMFNNKPIDFSFNWGGLRNNGKHIYFKVDCQNGQSIRDIMGLGNPYFGFHLTIGLVPKESNIKSEHLEQVRKYMLKYKQ